MASYVGLDPSKNVSFLTVPVVYLMALAPAMYAVSSAGKAFDPANPTKILDAVAKSDIDKVQKERIARAKNCSENGLQSVAFYASAVIAAHVARVDPGTVNTLALSYVLSRVAYSYVYIELQANRKLAGLRSLAWMGGISIILAIWVMAGRNLL